MNKPTIFIIDDDKHVIESMRWLMESVDYSVETYSDAQSYLDNCKRDAPGCLVVDVRMPGISGLELQEELHKRDITLPIIFITGHGDVAMAVRAMKAGAVDFLTKPVNNQLLLETINKAIVFDQGNRAKLAKSAEIHERAARLTQREKEVMQLMVTGKLTKVIADELDISPNTVELHRAKVMRKMEAKTLAELVSVVLNAGIIEENA
jgi:two-component system response regulator FixJ